MPFVIDANLDVESRWSGLALAKPVLERISYYATLLAVLAPKGEPIELWTPAAIDAKRVRPTGPLQLRVGTPPSPSLHWAQPGAKAANDRRLAWQLSRELGIGLPGAKVIERVDDITPSGPWVAKAPWTAAGRDRCRGEGAPNQEQATRLSRLLATTGALVVEPWCDRVLDIGTCGTVDAAGNVTLDAPHGLIVDARGGFLAIDLRPPALEAAERAAIESAARAAGEAIAKLGYRGPFAIDAFVYRDGETRKVHPLCEINARYSFGWIARAYARRTGATRLGFSAPPAGESSTILIEDREDHITAWIA